MEVTFYIKENRLNELKLFIKNNLPTVRFKFNPYVIGGEYKISFTLSVEDNNKLSQLQNKWHNQDNPIIQNKSIWYKILNFLNKKI